MQETTPIPLRPPPVRPAPQRTAEGARPKRKLKKLRLLLLVSVLSVLAVLSTIFGMMMAVSNELPKLEDRAQYRAARNSILFADGGKLSIAHLTDTQNLEPGFTWLASLLKNPGILRLSQHRWPVPRVTSGFILHHQNLIQNSRFCR